MWLRKTHGNILGGTSNRLMYMVPVCFYVSCGDCVGVCGNVCCVAAVVKDIVFFAFEC